MLSVGILALLGFLAPTALAAPGDLDSSFGTGGTASTDLGADDRGEDVALDSAGRIVVVGKSETEPEVASAEIVRYTTSGVLDTTFGGGDGIVSLHFGSDFDLARAVAIDASGRIIVAGLSNFVFALARLTSSGALDTTFGGGDGIVTRSTCFGGMGDVLVDQSGRIVVGCAESDDFTLLRYTASGELDPTFGGDGIVMTSFGAGRFADIASINLDDEQRIVAAGSVGGSGSEDFGAARYLEDGSLDPSFSGDGRMVSVIDGADFAQDAALDSHDRIVIVGDSVRVGEPFRYVVARYTPSGKPDPTFDTDGVRIGEDDSLADALVIDPQNRILFAGHTSALPGHEDGLVRLRSDGSLDPTFGGGGIAPLPNLIFSALTIDSSQRILVAGIGYASDEDLAVTRLEGGGTSLPEPPTITVETVGTGSGAVGSLPAGIDCGPKCAATFGEGEVITLTAEPAGNSEFAGWTPVSGDPGTCTGTTSPCEVTVGEYTELEASFDKGPVNEYTLTINKSGPGTGSISSSPSGIDCGLTCSHVFEEGTELTLAATASSGSVFAGWSGDCSGTGSCQVTMDAAKSVTASFNAVIEEPALDPPALPPASAPPPDSGVAPAPTPSTQPKSRKCKKGFKKRKVRGKTRCVRKKKRERRH